MTFLCRLLLCLGLLQPMVLRADPTGEQQYWLELINRARRDPAGELERLVNFSSSTSFGSPSSDNADVANALAYFGSDAATLLAQWSTLSSVSALAWNDALAVSATNYSQLMRDLDAQSHFLDGQSYEQRIGMGYNANHLLLGETLFATTASIEHGHAAFMIDWGDDDANPGNGFGTGIQSGSSNGTGVTHRELLLAADAKEIGIGWVTEPQPTSQSNARGPYIVTQHVGSAYRFSSGRFYSDAILTGVVFSDDVLANEFYTPDEGIAGTVVEVYNQNTGTLLFSDLTNAAGGFNIALAGVVAGDVLRISAPGTGLADQVVTVTGYTTDVSVYGAPVEFYDNVYAAFAMVPEPGGLTLACWALFFWCRQRRR
jgi:uncharacterized protein YkwD